MPGSNAGTGHRLSARCYRCAMRSRGKGYSLIRTGRKRERITGNNASGRVDPNFQYEYRCNHCGHVGWSRHIDLQEKQ